MIQESMRKRERERERERESYSQTDIKRQMYRETNSLAETEQRREEKSAAEEESKRASSTTMDSTHWPMFIRLF